MTYYSPAPHWELARPAQGFSRRSDQGEPHEYVPGGFHSARLVRGDRALGSVDLPASHHSAYTHLRRIVLCVVNASASLPWCCHCALLVTVCCSAGHQRAMLGLVACCCRVSYQGFGRRGCLDLVILVSAWPPGSSPRAVAGSHPLAPRLMGTFLIFLSQTPRCSGRV